MQVWRILGHQQWQSARLQPTTLRVTPSRLAATLLARLYPATETPREAVTSTLPSSDTTKRSTTSAARSIGCSLARSGFSPDSMT